MPRPALSTTGPTVHLTRKQLQRLQPQTFQILGGEDIQGTKHYLVMMSLIFIYFFLPDYIYILIILYIITYIYIYKLLRTCKDKYRIVRWNCGRLKIVLVRLSVRLPCNRAHCLTPLMPSVLLTLAHYVCPVSYMIESGAWWSSAVNHRTVCVWKWVWMCDPVFVIRSNVNLVWPPVLSVTCRCNQWKPSQVKDVTTGVAGVR